MRCDVCGTDYQPGDLQKKTLVDKAFGSVSPTMTGRTATRIGQASVVGVLLVALAKTAGSDTTGALTCGLSAALVLFVISLIGMDMLEFLRDTAERRVGRDLDGDGYIADEPIVRHVPLAHQGKTTPLAMSEDGGDLIELPPTEHSRAHKTVWQSDLWNFLVHAFTHKWSRDYWGGRGMGQTVWPRYRLYFEQLSLWQTQDVEAVVAYLDATGASPALLDSVTDRYEGYGNEQNGDVTNEQS